MIAVIDSFIPRTQPNKLANSPTTAVTAPIKLKEITKLALPPQTLAGGTKANNTFQPSETK